MKNIYLAQLANQIAKDANKTENFLYLLAQAVKKQERETYRKIISQTADSAIISTTLREFIVDLNNRIYAN